MTAHFATFRFSFAVVAFVANDAEKIRLPGDTPNEIFFSPGWLKDAKTL